MATTAEHWELMLSASSDADDVLDVLALARFVSGEHMACETFHLTEVPRVEDLVPVGSVTRVHNWGARHQVIAEGQGWVIKVDRFASGWTGVVVTAVDEEQLAKQVAAVRAAAQIAPWLGTTHRPPHVRSSL
jgi:hypothetical protein